MRKKVEKLIENKKSEILDGKRAKKRKNKRMCKKILYKKIILKMNILLK